MCSGTELSQFLRIFLPTLIPKRQFWIYIYLFQTKLFHPKLTVSTMTDFDIRVFFSFFLFWMGTSPVLPLTGFTFLNLFDLLESLVM